MDRYRRLFEPLRLGTRTARNRIVSTSHATAYDDDGVITDRLVDYEARKAAGGAGIVSVFGSASVDPESVASFGSVRLWDPANEPMLTALADRVHAAGALVLTQVTHMGRRGNTRKGGRLSAPSAVPEPIHREIPHVLSTSDIETIIRQFAAAAARVERCGFDGIELMGGGGQLVEQFFSPVTNLRTDRFGGGIEDRVRFATEVIEAIAAAVSPGFILGIKLSGDPSSTDFGMGPEEMRIVAKRLDSIGRLDFFNIAGSPAATHESTARSIPSAHLPLGTNLSLASEMRRVLNPPVLVAGRILDPAQAERALEDGHCDLVGMTRAIIADPDLPSLAATGSPETTRPCISINEGCIGRLYQGLEVRCVVNPSIAHPELASVGPAPQRRRVLVVGGGPAGLEAARAAAMRGHDTLLVEAETRLGGQLHYAKKSAGSARYDQYLDWISQRLEQLGVQIRLGASAGVDTLREIAPEHVVVATGASDYVPDVVRHARAVTDVDLYRDGAARFAGRAIVYDTEGHGRGPGAARWLVEHGADHVVLATDLLHISESLDPSQLSPVYEGLAAAGVETKASMRLREDGNGITHRWLGDEVGFADFDTVVTTGFRRSETDLVDRSAESPWSVTVIGDAYAPRRMVDAVLEGTRTGVEL